MDKGGKRSKKKKMNFERNYCNKVHRKETEQNMNRPCLKGRQPNHKTRPRNPPTEEKQRTGQFSKTNTPQNERTIRFNEIETRTEPEPISPDWRQRLISPDWRQRPIFPDWRQRRLNKGQSPITGNPSTRRTEQITKQSDESNWRSRRWEKPIKEVVLHFPYLIPFLFLFLSPPVEPSFLYLSFSHQNLLIHMPLFHFLHSLMHSLKNLLFNEHSLKAIPSFSIKHFQVGYLSLSLDLNVL